MFTVSLIAFREFLEVFLITGLFLGISKKLNLKKEFEIYIAGFVGIVFSLTLILSTYLFGNYARNVLTEKNADALESYLLIFSGMFIVYVVFSLHKILNKSSRSILNKTKEDMEQNVFDASLFLTIVFLIIREGFEVALFTASPSLFSSFLANCIGLILGFVAAGMIATLTSLAYLKVSLKKIFQLTEYVIILLGASLFQVGITIFLNATFHINLSNTFSFHLGFLPAGNSLVGGFLQNFIGIDQGFSLARLTIMVVYIFCVYFIFLQQVHKKIYEKLISN